MDFESASFLAFSSSLYRCQESAAETLRGLFSNEWPIGLGLGLAREYTLANCSSNDTCTVKSKLPDGFSWPSDNKNIPIDTQTLPMLSYEYLHRCKYRLAHPAPGEADLRALKGVKDLPDLKELEKILDSRYATKFNSTALDLWSTINDELRLIKTRQTIDWSKRHFDWINKPIGSNSKAASNKITLFDLYEQVVVLGYRYTTVGVARYVQVGPILTSLLESQKMALNYPNTSLFESSKMYANRKVILYSSHDEIMQLLMETLSIFDTQEDQLTFEQRSNKWEMAGEHEQFLAGLRMPKFGISMLVELWEAREAAKGTANRLAYLLAYLYNREDALAGVKYRRLEFGSICVRLFRKLYPDDESYLQFFAKFSQFKLDEKFSCPFELFKNVTSNYMISAKQLSDLCD